MERDSLMDNQLELFSKIKSIDLNKESKVCIYCNELKPTETFTVTYYRRDGVGRRSNICHTCKRKHTKQIEELKICTPYPNNKYVCPICLETKKDKVEDASRRDGSRSFWVLDHDHNTGTFRGWLCSRCNSALGWFKDDVDRVNRALNYLKDYEDSC